MYILNMIHFLMILADFGVFSLMVTDGHTDIRTYGRTDRPSYRDARTHLKTRILISISRPGSNLSEKGVHPGGAVP